MKNVKEDAKNLSDIYGSENGVIEESYYFDENLKDEEDYSLEKIYKLEKDESIIRYEMNTIEYPIFSRDKKIKVGEGKKYIFNKDKNQYIEVLPTSKNKIPQEAEEKIFFSLMRILKKQGYNKTIYTDYYTIIKEANLKYSGNSVLQRTKDALDRLSKTIYVFNNVFYSNRAKNILNDRIDTTMFSKREIQLVEAKENEQEMLKYFRSGRIKEIIEITFSKHFFDNIIRKGYLYFNSEELLDMDNSIARSIFMMVTKWRNKGLYIKIYSGFLASRIPLSWKKENVTKTVKTIIRAFDELKDKGAVKDYIFHRNGKNANSYFEVFFDKKHNINLFQALKTGQEDLKIISIDASANLKNVFCEEEIEKIRVKCNSTDKIIDVNIVLKLFNQNASEKFDFLLHCLDTAISKGDNPISYLNFLLDDENVKRDYLISKEKQSQKKLFDIPEPVSSITQEDIDKTKQEKYDYYLKKVEVLMNSLPEAVKKNLSKETMIEELIREDLMDDKKQ